MNMRAYADNDSIKTHPLQPVNRRTLSGVRQPSFQIHLSINLEEPHPHQQESQDKDEDLITDLESCPRV
jgi:hypothetical protein